MAPEPTALALGRGAQETLWPWVKSGALWASDGGPWLGCPGVTSRPPGHFPTFCRSSLPPTGSALWASGLVPFVPVRTGDGALRARYTCPGLPDRSAAPSTVNTQQLPQNYKSQHRDALLTRYLNTHYFIMTDALGKRQPEQLKPVGTAPGRTLLSRHGPPWDASRSPPSAAASLGLISPENALARRTASWLLHL